MALEMNNLKNGFRIIFVFFLLILLGLNVLAAEEDDGDTELPPLSPGEIDRCGMINQSGTYVLINDIIANDGVNDAITTCFEILSNNVVLDGGSNTIKSLNGSGEAIVAHGQEGSLNNIVVKNFVVENWYLGVKYNLVIEGSVESNSITGCSDGGITLMRTEYIDVLDNNLTNNIGRGMTVSNAKNTLIENNEIKSNEGDAGIKVMNSAYNTLLDNIISGHGKEKALHITGRSGHNTLIGNVFENNFEINAFGVISGPEFALKIGGESPDNLLRDNIVRNNIGGVSVDPGETVFDSNEVYSNMGSGVELVGVNGVITNNIVYNNSIDGLYVSGSNAKISHNEIYENKRYGLVLYGTSGNEILKNIIYKNYIEDFISVSNSNNYVEELSFEDEIVSFSGVDLSVKESQIIDSFPENFTGLGFYIGITNNSYNSNVLLDIYYDDTELSVVEESNLRMWRYYEDSWIFLSEGVNEVNTAENFVRVEASEFGVFAILLGDDISLPVADAGEDVTVDFGETILFDASDSYDNLGIKSYTWDFGDGESSEGIFSEHIYSDSGTYLVTLVVKDYYNNLDEDNLTVIVLIDDSADCTDLDGDEFNIEGGECGLVDCDDLNESINPSAEDIANDGIDQDCSGEDKKDIDEDGIEDFEDFIIGTDYDITSNMEECSLHLRINGEDDPINFEGYSLVQILDCEDNVIVEFNYYFDEETNLDLFDTVIMLDEFEGSGSVCVDGINLDSQNLTKTLYVNKASNLSSICIKDAHVSSVSEISSNCDAVDETLMICPSTNLEKGYNCSYSDETNTTYKISGLLHSAIIQKGYCGDGITQDTEECDGESFCTSSCEVIKTTSTTSSTTQTYSGGGSSGSNVCSSDYVCGSWSLCLESNTRDRECDDVSGCNFSSKIETEKCVFEDFYSDEEIEFVDGDLEVSEELSLEDEETYEDKETEGKSSLLTGAIVKMQKFKPSKTGAVLIISFIFAVALLGYYRFNKK